MIGMFVSSMNGSDIMCVLTCKTGGISSKYSLLTRFSFANQTEPERWPSNVIKQFHEFLKNVEEELPVRSHEVLASSARHLVQEKAIHYEKRLVLLCNRHIMAAVTQNNSGNMLQAIMRSFVQCADAETYSPMFVHRTLLVFLRDWVVASNLQDAVLQYHGEKVQGLMNKPGWANMTTESKLLAALMFLQRDIMQLDDTSFVVELHQTWKPFWLSMPMKEFYGICINLRRVIIEKQE